MFNMIKDLQDSPTIEKSKEFLERIKEWSELSDEDLKKVILESMEDTLSSPEKMKEFKDGLKETRKKALEAIQMLEALEEVVLKLKDDDPIKVLNVDMDDFIDKLK